MVHPRIVPWYNEDELKELKDWFYNKELATGMRFRAIQRVKSYQSKGSQYLPHVIDSTAQITNSILLDEERSQYDKFSVKLSYTMSLIRFVNGILDPTQQSQFAIPLHTLAKRVGLPSWFVDLRHWGTHERELPSLEMLRIAAKDALVWLWDHYWNDDELEEEDEEEENVEDEHTVSLRQLIRRGKSLQNLFKEYQWYWEEGSTNLISSTNFQAEEPSHGKRRREPTPQEQIDAFLSDCKDVWNNKDHREKFMNVFTQQYTPTLLRVLVMKLQGFSQEFFQFILQNYKDQLAKTPSVLSQRFSTWESLERKLLSKFVSSVNTNQFVSAWSSWEPLISENPSLLSYSFCQLMSNRLADNRDSFKKKKKKRQFVSYQEVESGLSEYVAKYSSFIREAESYNKQVQAHAKAQLKAEVPMQAPATDPIPKDMSDILKDLESLKRRHTDPPKTKAQWCQHPDWSPRPFGTL
ncbi:hypothetical protein ZYGR_0N00740 [Zygosaccharomyces rouxii]|uniref:Las1p n=1 Tax=Zygosaccharomyces rouxii TaxID=4956 RepID=A0A1Q2ZZ06_ZYGRO|nr:hypothetical protein ZYGR_0N00740 [Zygosaccharomyces rouxii]